jgi:hypothetical protein
MFGVSPGYVDKARELLADAPEAAAMVERGDATLTAAHDALQSANRERERAESATAPGRGQATPTQRWRRERRA